MAPFIPMESPMYLVANSTDGKLSVCQDAVVMLTSIDQPLVVVALVGKYRTGKSFLLNRLAKRNTGFAIASSVQSQTKGIWMWCLPHPCLPEHCMVLLDTEGLGDVEKGDDSNDNKIFALAVLMSTMLVYNSKGTIDQQALQDINYVTELTQLIKTNSKTDNEHGDNFMEYFPRFVWTVRDFTLELKISGKTVTADQYLENALKLKTGSSKKAKQYNLPRECLRYYFRSRNCFVFDCPGNKKILQNIATVDDSELESDFVETCNAFCEFIYTTAEKKTIPGCGGKLVTGETFAQLLNTYVDILSSGKHAFLDKVIQSLAETENEKAVEEAIQCYEKLMKQVILPMDTVEELNQIHEKSNKESFDIFLKRALGERMKHQDKLQDTIKTIFDDYCQRNVKASENKCINLLMELFGEIENKFKIDGYAKPGGYSEYVKDRNHAENTYRLTTQKGVKRKTIKGP
uniref:guanylate-binding protein 2-like isoform X2 n=1 Tax=Pristiophorus japonicus TaxID=55135 RepID=UPI00398E742D